MLMHDGKSEPLGLGGELTDDLAWPPISMVPASGRTSPDAIPISVDLPAPFSPSSASHLSRAGGERNVLDRLDPSETLGNAGHCNAADRPLADGRPRCATRNRSATISSRAGEFAAEDLDGLKNQRKGPLNAGPASMIPPGSETALQRGEEFVRSSGSCRCRQTPATLSGNKFRPSENRPS